MEGGKCWCCSEAGPPEVDASRDFDKTLIAAGSTLFLLIAANWQLGILSGIGEPPEFRRRCRATLLRTVFAIMLSFFTLTLSFIDVYSVFWLWRKEGEFEQYQEGFISVAKIMGTCPILIAIPPSHWQSPDALARRIGGTFTSKLDEGLNPLPLSPRPQQPAATDAAHDHMDQPAASTPTGTSLEAHVLTTTTAQPAALSPCTDASYIVLSPLLLGRHSTRARLALLRLMLVPKYQELCLLRSRSRFQNGVTFLQVAGYIMGVALRMGEHLAISPLEAILSFFCIQVMLQLAGALFACGHYQRPLLLHLKPCEFSLLLEKSSRGTNASASKRLVKYCIISSGLVLTLFLLPAPLVYYALFIRHRCRLCFFSTLFMAFLPLLSFLIMGALVWLRGGLLKSPPRVTEIWPPRDSLWLPRLNKGGLAVSIALIIIALLYFTGILLAGLATYRHWALFNTHTSYAWVAWILPHVSSS